MGEPELRLLASGARIRYYPRGAVILEPGHGPVDTLFIIQRGCVEAAEPEPISPNPLAGTLTEGEMFPVGALVARRATTLRYSAAQDTFCYRLGKGSFAELMARSPAFADFCTRRLAALLAASSRGTREAYSARVAGERTMASPLRSAIRRAPVTLPAAASVRETLELMRARRIGSIVLTDEAGAPSGIFTQTDVLNRVALAERPLDRPVSEVMTAQPMMLDADERVSTAAQLMARNGFRHVLVMEGARLIGVISERDLFGLQRLSMQGLRKDIARSDSVDALVLAAREVRQLAGAMLAQGVAAEPLTQFISTLNDALVQRAIELALRRDPIPAGTFCWMGLGSEGRAEQTLATDQDNAIVFVDPGEAREALRGRLLAFAAEVNATLDACGFPLCKGDVMARNRAWCLTVEEWLDRFERWIDNTVPAALLNAAIFFDLRALHGEAMLVERLRDFILAAVRKRPVFLRQMAANAIETRPPVGIFGTLGDAGGIDLKKQAARVFVDCARILALGNGVRAVSTAARLREAGPLARMKDDDVGAAVDAFHFVQMLRLRAQEDPGAPREDGNRIDPDTLNPLDRRILREALRQARKLQNRLALDYQL